MDIIDYLNGIASYKVLTDEKRCLIIYVYILYYMDQRPKYLVDSYDTFSQIVSNSHCYLNIIILYLVVFRK